MRFCYPSHTVKPVLNGHSKIDKTKILMTNGSLMKVESIAEFLEHSAILLTCIKQYLVFKPILAFLRVAVLERYYCMCKDILEHVWIAI